MAYETKCRILIVNKKNWLVQSKDHVKKNLNTRKQKIRDETPKCVLTQVKTFLRPLAPDKGFSKTVFFSKISQNPLGILKKYILSNL